ncbi:MULTISPECIES: inorganic diphosphatase [Halorhodospira]|uniref:inorganic diphosphatase n=1 Tax=Halorhodospira TaxID=85108 RepID=UPI00191128B5|nr:MULTISPECIES: inorganic diphosphatase [Halorhodospira]MBK5935555.1 inorganic pyrophosphatase [Halorhodospira halophila]MBK5944316.1 inorganic pyrophosphatase [Halorhodospira halophila]MCG5527563.1 inorganic diphosphatase [Halorhodospira halophila]MCG5532582.1 inorganic diphosphatase [Halorhodospira sp. 9621]MCG5539024.1 inorganic diphosphatase [Halorhodospira sp. 9622]
MSLDSVPAGRSIPDDINVVIEIPLHGGPVKYEVDKETGALTVDRIMATAMHYPCNYGFVPQTLADDGDPVDALVITPLPLQPGSVIRCRPVGVLEMADESGEDAKLIAVPVDKLTTDYSEVKGPDDLPPRLLQEISHFFEHYKDLEPGKWVQVRDWKGADAARAEIEHAVSNYRNQ